MMSWISIFTLVISLGAISAQLVIYDINTQPKCTEIQRAATGDCRWSAGLDMVDQIIENGRIAAYQIQWSTGWSGWYVPGLNDLDTKYNPSAQVCSVSYRANTMRRVWSYFRDHTHKFIICKPN